MPSAISTPTYQAQNSNIANDGSADSPRGWAISTNADYTFTSTGPSRVRATATSASRSVNLPTTGIKAGYEAEVVTACTSPYTIIVKSSDGDTVDTMIGTKGRIRCVALQDTPTDATHWEVVEVEDEGTWTPTLSVTGTTGNFAATTGHASYTRIGNMVIARIEISCTQSSTATGQIRFTLPINPARNASCFGYESSNTSKGVTGLINTSGYCSINFADAGTVTETGSTRYFYVTSVYQV